METGMHKNFIKKISEKTNLPEQKVRYYTAIMLRNYYNLKMHRHKKRARCSISYKRHGEASEIMQIKNLLKKELQNT